MCDHSHGILGNDIEDVDDFSRVFARKPKLPHIVHCNPTITSEVVKLYHEQEWLAEVCRGDETVIHIANSEYMDTFKDYCFVCRLSKKD